MTQGSIFISIASYRDKICPITVESIYTNAEHPEKVFVGICQQNDKKDADCINEGMKKFPKFQKNVRVLRLRHNDAKGPTFARFLCSTLYGGEQYYLQIDSHCKFIKNWDTHLIKMITDLKESGIPKPVLSHYTPTFESYDENGEGESITTICESWFTDQNMISLKGAGWVNAGKLPHPNAYIAAGMFFCEAKFLDELPFDPELDFLFIGEELLLSVRFYTHGWDIFTPNKNTIYHLYTREHEPKYWENRGLDSEQASKKVRYLLGLDTDSSKLTERQIYSLQFYGLGQERTLDDYYKYAGIDIEKKQILKNMCHAPTHIEPGHKEEPKRKKRKQSSTTKKHWCKTILFLFLVAIITFYLFKSNSMSTTPKQKKKTYLIRKPFPNKN